MVNLKQIDPADYEQIRKWAQDKALAEYWRRHPPVFTWPGDLAPWFSTSYVVREEDKPVGLLCLANWDTFNKQVEFGIMIDPVACQDRRAVAHEACKQALDYVFDYCGFEKAYCKVLCHRKALKKFLVDCGCKVEGILRRNCWFEAGFHDEILVSILKEERPWLHR